MMLSWPGNAHVNGCEYNVSTGTKVMKASILVRAEWDSDAEVWVATSDDVPGLITEAETPEALERKLLVMIPELLELNDDLLNEFPPEVPVFIAPQHVTMVRLRA